MKQYNAVIFDLDGTLLDTLDDLKDSVNFALNRQGYPERSREEIRQFVGNGVKKLIERAVPSSVSKENVEQTLSIFKEHYSVNMQNKTGPYDGIMELLYQLKERKIPAAIVSNKFDPAVKELSRQFFDGYMQAAIGESETVARKPAPDTAYEALAQLGISADQTVYVGDSDVDIQTAKNAGIDCISVTWGFRDRDFLFEHGANIVIDHPLELLKYIKDYSK